jgi:hypothetical protein
MEITTSLTQLIASLLFLMGPTSLEQTTLPKVAGEQIIFNSQNGFTVKKYQQMPCPLKVTDYVTIYDENANNCVYVPPTELIKLFAENK